jgi:hypothetical protein
MQSSASPAIGDLKSEVASLAVEVAGIVSDNGKLSDALRQRFLAVRTELFKRGVFDPVLARFDSGTVTPPSLRELAEELAKVAEALGAGR